MVIAFTAFFDAGFGFSQSVGLPAPRLLALMPMGGQVGTELDVTVSGQSIEGDVELHFLTDQIHATRVQNEDGKPTPIRFRVSIDPNCPAGLFEARLWTRLGMSTPRVFCVGELPEIVQTKPALSLDQAIELDVNSICNANMPVRGINHYRFQASEGDQLVIDCAAGGIESKLKPVVIVADSNGQDMVAERRGDRLVFTAPRTEAYHIKVHDLTFQGGDNHFYRLGLRTFGGATPPPPPQAVKAVNAFSWPPAVLSQDAPVSEDMIANRDRDLIDQGSGSPSNHIELPCDIVGRFYPAADVDTFDFQGRKGDSWWVEVASDRLGRPTDPMVLVQRMDETTGALSDVAELTDIPSPVKVSSNHYTYDGPPYHAGTSDVLGHFTLPQDGSYRLSVTDLFGGTREDARNRYRMIVRRATPDFAIVGWAMHMELRNGDRNALSKPLALRPGTTMAIEVVVIRRDGFDGAIELSMEGLPEGVSAVGLNVPAGQSRGHILLTADREAPAGWKRCSLYGSADIEGVVVKREGRLAMMRWPVKDARAEIPNPRLLLDSVVSVSRIEPAPLTVIAESEDVLEATVGSKLTIPLSHFQNAEFSGKAVSMKTLGSGFEKNAKFDLPFNVDSSEVVIDLAALKTTPGDYTIAFCGAAVAKYAPPPLAIGGDRLGKPKDIVDILISKPIRIQVRASEDGDE